MVDFSTLLDKTFEYGSSIYNRMIERDIAVTDARAQEAVRDAENSRLAQLEFFQKYGNAQDSGLVVGGYELPRWVVPVSLGVAALYAFKKFVK